MRIVFEKIDVDTKAHDAWYKFYETEIQTLSDFSWETEKHTRVYLANTKLKNYDASFVTSFNGNDYIDFKSEEGYTAFMLAWG